mgnify:FL=1
MEHREFSALYRQWYRPLLLYAFSLTGNLMAAEDLVQSTFVKALLSYRSGGSVQAWLKRVLRNEFVSNVRHDGRLSHIPPEEMTAESSDPLDQLLQREEQRRVYEAVLSLRAPYREVLLQSAVMGLQDEEIARLLQTTPENVRQLRCRARQKIRRILKKEEP